MSPQTSMSLMGAVECALWAILALLFWRKRLARRFKAMGIYLALHATSTPSLLLLSSGNHILFPSNLWPILHFYVYWTAYIASAVLMYFVCMEVFRSALSAFPGLMKFGLLVIRWPVLASVIVTFSSVSFAHKEIPAVNEIAYGLMRSASILELSLLAFLCLSMGALRLSVRDLTFGIALGFGMMSSSDFVLASFWYRKASLTDPLQFVCESVILAALGSWIVYCALPEPPRKPMVMPVNSTIYRWNEIASALGHTGTQVAVQQPANSFFLTDVERVVEQVLSRNRKDREFET